MAKRIRKPADLRNLRERSRSDLEVRGPEKDWKITVHMGTCGIAAGARDVVNQLVDELDKSAARNVTLSRSGCLGLCDQEPLLTVSDREGKSHLYGKVDGKKVREIVRRHVLGGEPVPEYLLGDINSEDTEEG